MPSDPLDALEKLVERWRNREGGCDCHECSTYHDCADELAALLGPLREQIDIKDLLLSARDAAIQDLNVEIKELREKCAAEVQAEREACAKDICVRCRMGATPEYLADVGRHCHRMASGDMEPCAATSILSRGPLDALERALGGQGDFPEPSRIGNILVRLLAEGKEEARREGRLEEAKHWHGNSLLQPTRLTFECSGCERIAELEKENQQ